MAMQIGEVYRCSHEECQCEIKVTRGAGSGGGELNPRCCCGMEMKKIN